MLRRIVPMGVILLCGSAWAGDEPTIVSMEVYGTIHAAGVTLAIQDDDNGNATATLEYREKGGGSFTEGHSLARLIGDRFKGSLFYLQPDTEYEVKVTLTDPDSAAPESRSAMMRTRADAPPAATGKTWVVSTQRGGTDGAGTQAEPFATIAEGLANAGPGETVQVEAGVYRESIDVPTDGESAAPIWVQGLPGAVLDGSDAALGGTPAWTLHQDNIYWAPFSGERLYYLAVGDTRIYDYTSLTDLQDETGGQSGQSGVLKGGFFVDTAQQRLYLRLPDDSSPEGQAVHAAVLDHALLLDGRSFIVIDGFEIRYYGGQYGVGVDLRGARRCWVRSCHLHHLQSGIRARKGTSENVIEENVIEDTSIYEWPWSSVKAHTGEASAISLTGGKGDIARRNRIDGLFNGIYTGQWDTTDEGIATEIDVYENTMGRIGDDGLEPEGACVNQRFWENVISDAHNAISLAPIETGPAWFVRNVILRYGAHALKINNGPEGHMFLYHTTATPGDSPDAQAISPSLPFGNFTAKNNIWGAHRYVIEYTQTGLAGPVAMDHDDLYTDNADGGEQFVKWKNERYASLQELASATGLEQHGFSVQPLYEDLSGGDLTLTEGHALLDQALPIPGINHVGLSGPPDVGAFERGGIKPGPDQESPPPPADGGVSSDGGVPPVTDGGQAGGDRSQVVDPPHEVSEGCSCRVGTPLPSPVLFLLWMLLGLRRRRG